MSSTAKSAVSDYEHLNKRPVTGSAIGINESDDDELFLKAPTPKAFVDTLNTILNKNNSNLPPYTLRSKDFLETVNNVPVPSSWSPGMALQSNPDLLITPEKPPKSAATHGNNIDKDHMLETDNVKIVPQPVPWSPGMRPEKTIFITPDKDGLTIERNKNYADNMDFDFDPADSSTAVSKGTAKSNKERQTVRFDLPSNSSGEDTFFDENSSLFSPVTIKGKDLSPSPQSSGGVSGSGRPHFTWKSHGTKSYNPSAYSDDSSLDESMLLSKHYNMSQPPDQNIESHPNSSNITLSTSANLLDKLKELMQDSNFSTANSLPENIPTESLVINDNGTTLQECSTLDAKYTKGSRNSTKPSILTALSGNQETCSSQIFQKETQIRSSKSHSIKSKKSKKYNEKAGPHLLKDSVSPYYPPSAGSCIVKEPHIQIESQEYSYPFQDGAKDDNEIEHAFARPEFNSTLKFRRELDDICDQEIDVVKAVNEKLKLSSDKRAEIHEKAATLTNCPSDQFTNLIDLDLPVDRLCDRIVRMRTSKAVKKKKLHSEKKITKTTANVPDLMDFYSPEFQKDMAGFSLQSITPATPDLLSASSDLAFDVYRHNRVWEGLHDF